MFPYWRPDLLITFNETSPLNANLDATDEGNFTHVSTKESMVGGINVKWMAGEPNGRREENCVALNYDKLNDVPCSWNLAGFCNINPMPRMKLRGKGCHHFLIMLYQRDI